MCWPSCGYNGDTLLSDKWNLISVLISGITTQLSYVSLSGNMNVKG
jgi:hypothetical protein